MAADSPFCPIPGLGYCIRERCNHWDDAQQECTAICFDAVDQEGGSQSDPEGGCLITFYEDFD